MDDDDHEGRRTAAALALAALIGGLAVGAMFWLFGSTGSSPLARVSAALSTPLPGGASATADVAALDVVPTTATTTFTPPSPTYAPRPVVTISLPPPELPTMTATAPQTPAPGVTPASPPPATGGSTGPAAASLAGLSLGCTRAGGITRASLSFRTTATVTYWLTGGGQVSTGSAPAGTRTVTASGKSSAYCMAVVGSQRLGPVAAR